MTAWGAIGKRSSVASYALALPPPPIMMPLTAKSDRVAELVYAIYPTVVVSTVRGGVTIYSSGGS
jgi:hypothetical protein